MIPKTDKTWIVERRRRTIAGSSVFFFYACERRRNFGGTPSSTCLELPEMQYPEL